MVVVIFVPRQLRRSDFPSSVPFYGGRLTPQVISGLQRPVAPGPPPAASGSQASDADRVRRLATLDDLRAEGIVTEGEYGQIRQRILGGG
jgi:hypothetical protein